MIPGILVHLAIRTRNPLNSSHIPTMRARIGIAKARQREKETAYLQVLAALRSRGCTGADFVPIVVTLVRFYSGRIDDDGAIAGLKWVRDGIARALGVDDGDRKRIRFRYGLRKVKRGNHGVEVVIETRPS